jgi:hypothetical protein
MANSRIAGQNIRGLLFDHKMIWTFGGEYA